MEDIFAQASRDQSLTQLHKILIHLWGGSNDFVRDLEQYMTTQQFPALPRNF